MPDPGLASRPVLLVGATGLVGRQVVARHRQGDWRLVALARRSLGGSADAVEADPADWPAVIARIAPHAVICALGTTWRKAGRGEAAFRAVDHHLVLGVARAARAAGTGHFVLVSATGAERRARGFYLCVKGEVEAALGETGFRRLDILRTGLLRGRRGGERRVLEQLAIAVSPFTDRLLPPAWRSIDAGDVAAAALAVLHEVGEGCLIHDNAAMLHLARPSSAGTRQ